MDRIDRDHYVREAGSGAVHVRRAYPWEDEGWTVTLWPWGWLSPSGTWSRHITSTKTKRAAFAAAESVT